MQVTNKRVIFRAAGRSIGGRTTLQHEFSIGDISGVEARSDYKFSLLYLIFAFFILNLSSFIISTAVLVFTGHASPVYDIRPASRNMMSPPHIQRVREDQREAVLLRGEADARAKQADNVKKTAGELERKAIDERIAAEKKDVANPAGRCFNGWYGVECDKAYYKNQKIAAQNKESAAIAARVAADREDGQAAALRDACLEKEKEATKKRESAEKTWTALMILLGLALGFGGLAPFFLVYKRFGLKLFLLNFSSFGFLLCGAAYPSIIFLLLTAVSAVSTVVCVFVYCFRPNLVIGIKNRMGVVEPVNIRTGRKIGFSEVIPTEETERAIREIGAIIGDIQKMGDEGAKKWAKEGYVPSPEHISGAGSAQNGAPLSRPNVRLRSVNKKYVIAVAAAAVVCVAAVVVGSVVKANKHKGLFKAGMAYLANEKYGEAINKFSDAIKSNSKEDANYYFQRGVAYSKKEDYVRAAMDYTEAIRLDAGNVSYYVERAGAHLAVKDYGGAVADYTEAIRLDAGKVSYYSERAEACLAMKDYRCAIDDYTVAIRLDPSEARYYNSRGNVRRIIESYDEAIADHAEAIRINPDDARYHNNRGVAYLLKKDYDNAIANYSEAIQRAPGDAKYYNNRGSAYNFKKDFANAVADFEEAQRLDPNNEEYRKNFENATKSLSKK